MAKRNDVVTHLLPLSHGEKKLYMALSGSGPSRSMINFVFLKRTLTSEQPVLLPEIKTSSVALESWLAYMGIDSWDDVPQTLEAVSGKLYHLGLGAPRSPFQTAADVPQPVRLAQFKEINGARVGFAMGATHYLRIKATVDGSGSQEELNLILAAIGRPRAAVLDVVETSVLDKIFVYQTLIGLPVIRTTTAVYQSWLHYRDQIPAFTNLS